MVAVAAKGLGTGEGWFERGQGAHLPARRASKDPPTVTSVGERQRRARAGAAFLAGRRRDMARNDLKLGGITPWLFFFPVFSYLVTLRATCRLRRTTTQCRCGVLRDIMLKQPTSQGCD